MRTAVVEIDTHGAAGGHVAQSLGARLDAVGLLRKTRFSQRSHALIVRVHEVSHEIIRTGKRIDGAILSLLGLGLHALGAQQLGERLVASQQFAGGVDLGDERRLVSGLSFPDSSKLGCITDQTRLGEHAHGRVHQNEFFLWKRPRKS